MTDRDDAILRALLDELDEGQLGALSDELRDDADARRDAIALARIAALLHVHRQTLGQSPSAAPKPRAAAQRGPGVSPPTPRRIPPAVWAVSTLAAAVLVAAAALAIYVWSANPQSEIRNPNSDTPIATLIETTDNGALTTPGDLAVEGSEYGPGEYTLNAGAAEFMLTNSVNVKLRGHSRMIMHNDMSVSLSLGSAEFVVPKDATGFTVHLPDRSKIVDLGTAFRVAVDEDGQPKLRVTTGSVEWHAADKNAQPVVIAAGYSASLVDGRPVVTLTNTTTIAYLGFDATTQDAWRSSSVVKNPRFDPNGDNAYGNDGYFAQEQHAGANASPAPLATALPPYIASIQHIGQHRFNGAGYPAFDDPDAAISPTVYDINAGFFNDGRIDFTLATDARFVLTIALSGNSPVHNPKSITITQTAGGDASASTDSVPKSVSTVEYLFFAIDGSAGDAFSITGVTNQDTPGVTGLAAVAFEAITAAPDTNGPDDTTP